jgi:serine/threonine-protein kinase
LDRVIGQKYRLVRELGAGGMGAVYEGLHTGVGKRVAVKLLHAHLLELDPTTLTRLEREARLAGSLESPQIAQVFDVGIDEPTGSPFLVLEYLEGCDLEKAIEASGPLPYRLAVRIAAQACMGLKKAHTAGVVHRDIKPANLFLAQREDDIVVKLLDFGIAKPYDEANKLESPSLTRTGSLIGSPLYMSPEQARGLKTLDHRADLWSLGVALYTALVGHPPHNHVESLGDLIFLICSQPAPSVRTIDPSIPESVAKIVERALALAPDDRYPSAEAMYDALIGALGTDAKGSARHAIALTELPAVAEAAERVRATAAASAGASGAVGPNAVTTKKKTSGTALMESAPTQRAGASADAARTGSGGRGGTELAGPASLTDSATGAPVSLAQSATDRHAGDFGVRTSGGTLHVAAPGASTHGASVQGVERPSVEAPRTKSPVALYAGGTLAIAAVAGIVFATSGGPATGTAPTSTPTSTVAATSEPAPSPPASAAPTVTTTASPTAGPGVAALTSAAPTASASASANGSATGRTPSAGTLPKASAAPTAIAAAPPPATAAAPPPATAAPKAPPDAGTTSFGGRK